MKQVSIYTDGACEGNPGPGGWAAILIHKSARREITGACAATTNNRMELTAALEALRTLKEPCEVDLYTDSQYVQKGMNAWVGQWKAKGWRRGKLPVMNVDLWKGLDAEAARHQVRWHWVRGHNHHPENERCDRLAVAAIAKLRGELGAEAIVNALREFKAEPAGLFEAEAIQPESQDRDGRTGDQQKVQP
jgi:ribonuclease HI